MTCFKMRASELSFDIYYLSVASLKSTDITSYSYYSGSQTVSDDELAVLSKCSQNPGGKKELKGKCNVENRVSDIIW